MTQQANPRKRVLVVDDEVDLARLICELLSTAGGVDAHHVGDGEAALAAWKAQPADLLIVDCAMPGMNGLELLTALRQLNGAPVRAIMISGNPVGEQALKHGVDVFLAKPFSMRRLLAEVAGCLARTHRLGQPLHSRENVSGMDVEGAVDMRRSRPQAILDF